MSWSLFDRQSYFGLTRRQLQTLYLVAASGLAALVPLILFAGFWIRGELGKSQREIESFLGARASALSQRADAEIERQLAALQALASLPSLDEDVERFEQAAKRVSEAMPHWAGLSLFEPSTGRVVFSSGPDSADRPDPVLARRAGAERRPVIETRPVEAGRRGGILLYMPVVRAQASPYLFLLSFDASDIQDLLGAPGSDGVVSVVVDGAHRLLARSPESDSLLGSELLPAFSQGVDGHRSGLLKIETRDGGPISTAFFRSDLTGWVSAAFISRRRSEQLLSRSVWATTAAGALSLAIAGILAVFIIHNVMERRVSNERLAASRALGDLDARLLATSQEALSEQRKAASEREVLLREIYHRVKNNLQIVQSLLRLGSRDLKVEQREPFENAVRRIGAMARVHTLLYNSPDLASIDFKDYLDELLKELSEGFSAEERSIESVLEADAMRMPLDTAVPLAFIAVEILTNSFKHAFPEGRAGRITVEVQRDEGTATMRIRDDGVGLSYGHEAKRRLGLTIVRKLVQQIGGVLEEPPPGSSVFVVHFPLASPEGQAPSPPLTRVGNVAVPAST